MIRVGVIEQRAFLSILQRIEMHAKTGLLTFIHHEQEAELYFQQGQLTSIGLKKAFSLGERLVQAHIISRDDLQAALLTLLANESHSPAPEDRGDALIAQTLLELGLLHREQLKTWITQEAVEILQDLLTWSESDVSFVEGVPTPPDRLLLDHRITLLISSLSNGNAASCPSHIAPTSVKRKLSLPTTLITTPPSNKALPSIKHISDTRTPVPLPGLVKTSTPSGPKIMLPTRLLPPDHKTSAKKSTTGSMKALTRDPHLEKFNTVSITALKAITHPKG